MKLRKDVSLKPLNTFGIDVKADLYCPFSTTQVLAEVLKIANDQDKTLILGGGSNVLFTNDYKGLIIHNEIRGIEIIKKDKDYAWVKAGGGVIWQDLVEFCLENDFGGIENLSLIPGTTGAAPMQNIGAYGVELKEVFDQLEAFDRAKRSLEVFDKEKCQFGYRDSFFKKDGKDKYVICSVTLKLTTRDHDINTGYGAIRQVLNERGVRSASIRDISSAVIFIRKSKLPDPSQIGNAGSFFKNPVIDKIDFEGLKLEFPDIQGYETDPEHVKIPAGMLIEKCGWKGKRIGDIGVHKDQALVLINYGEGKGEEIKTLAWEIQKSVAETFGIELKTEVNII